MAQFQRRSYSLKCREKIRHLVKIKFRRENCYHIILLLKKKFWQNHHDLSLWIEKRTYNLVETLCVHISSKSETTTMSIRKKVIQTVKYPILDLRKKLNKEKLDKSNLLQAHKYKENQLQYHFHKYNENKYSSDINGYLA